MRRSSNTSVNKIITPSEVYSVLTNKVFNIFKIRVARTGNIKIEIEPAKEVDNGMGYRYMLESIEYTIGYTKGIGYWLRRKNENGATFPLHYNRNTHEYGFKTFEEAVAHLEKLFINKYFYIKPVTE